MWYVKNVPLWERLLRGLVGVTALGYSYTLLGTSMLGVIVGLSCATFALTGLFGYCPMCAIAGRKIDQ